MNLGAALEDRRRVVVPQRNGHLDKQLLLRRRAVELDQSAGSRLRRGGRERPPVGQQRRKHVDGKLRVRERARDLLPRESSAAACRGRRLFRDGQLRLEVLDLGGRMNKLPPQRIELELRRRLGIAEDNRLKVAATAAAVKTVGVPGEELLMKNG